MIQMRGSATSYYTVRIYRNSTQISSDRLCCSGTSFETLMFRNVIIPVSAGAAITVEVSTNSTTNGLHGCELYIREV